MRTARIIVAALAVALVGSGALLLVTLSVPAPRPTASSPAASAPVQIGAVGPTSSPVVVSPTPAPATTPSPTTTPSPLPVAALPCGEAVAYVERVANTVAAVSELSDAVITANIVSISDGRWATADGTRPYIEWLGKPWLRLPITEQVYSIMVARITGVGKESLADASIAAGQLLSVRVLGGTIGCRMFKFSDDLQYAVGDDVVLFLGQQPALADAPAGDFDAIDVWPIVSGIVEGRDKPMSPAELLAASDTTNP